jgi:hypothetical protein
VPGAPSDAWTAELPAPAESPPTQATPADAWTAALPQGTDPAGASESLASSKDDWTVALPEPAEPAATGSQPASSVDAWAVGLPDSAEVSDASPAPATSGDAWTVGLPEASEVPPSPATPETPANAWATGLPDSSQQPAAPAPPATPASAWATGLPDPSEAPALSSAPEDAPPEKEPAPVVARKGQHTLADHLGGKPEAIVELFGRLDEYAGRLDVTRRIRKRHVEYLRRGKRCFTIEVQRERALLCLTLDATAVSAWSSSPGAESRPVEIRERDKHHVEYAVGDAAQLDDAYRLIDLAYNEPSGPQAKG